MKFAFGNISINSKKQSLNLEIVDNPIMSDCLSSPADYKSPIVILSDEYYSRVQLNGIEQMLRANRINKFIILGALNCRINKKQIVDEQKCGIIDFYKVHRSHYQDFIPKNATIITVGSALYAVTREDDIYPSHFTQIIFDKPCFWYSHNLTTENGNWIFPIESFNDIFANGFMQPADSYKYKLAQIAFKTIINNVDNLSPLRYPKLTKYFIETKEDFHNIFYIPNKQRHNEILSWDLETSGLNFYKSKIGCITLSFDGITGYYVRWDCVIKEELNEILGNNKQLGANLKFDIKYLWKEGIPNARVDEDIFTIGHTLDETRSNSLKALAFIYSEYGGYERPLDEYKSKVKIDNYLDIDESVLREYAIMDAIVTRRVFNNILAHMRDIDKIHPNEKVPKHSLEDYYRSIRIPSNNMYAKLEYRGIYINKDKLDNLRLVMTQAIKDVKKQLAEQFKVSDSFDWGSDLKVGKFFESLHYEDLGRNSAGAYKVADFQLKRWKKNHPEVETLQTLRSYQVLLNTFVGDESGSKGWSQYLVHHPEDKPNIYRMHASYSPHGTDSGRTKCNEPNLQNIPTRGAFTKEIKQCICTPDDDEYLLVTVDYSALQMRLAAIDCKDTNLCNAFSKNNADIHSSTGYNVFAKGHKYDIEEITVTQDNKVYHFLGGEQVVTQRGDILAKDLTEEDTLIV